MNSSERDFLDPAFSTNSRIFETVDSPKALVVLMRRTPVRLMHPLMTESPSATLRGTLSPVSAAVSSEDVPLSTVPSMGIFSPGRTTITVPGSTSSGLTCTRPPSFSMLA